MRSGLVIVLSALAHCALLAALARWVSHPAPRPASAPSIAIEVVAAAPPAAATAPLEVAIVALPEPAAAPAPARTAAAPTRAAPQAARAVELARATTAGQGSAGAPPAPQGDTAASHGPGAAGSLRMRYPDLTPSPGSLARIAGERNSAPPPVHESGRLENAPNGTAVIHDEVTTITVERDGTAHFHDARDFDIHFSDALRALMSVDELRHGLGAMIDNWYADPYAMARGGRIEDLPPDQRAVPGACDHWGECAVAEPDSPSERLPPTISIPFLGGKADVTGWVMRKAGIDPYSSRKAALLDATRDERAARGGEYRAEQLERSAEIMRRNLTWLWAHVTDAAQRRLALFELWDECAEGDGPLGEAGQRARAIAIGWIASHVPGGYPADELAALNARRVSKQPFAP